MKTFKKILPLVFLVFSYGCSSSHHPESLGNNASDGGAGSEPVVIHKIEPHPINPTIPATVGSTLQLVNGGFQSVDSGNQNYRSSQYQGHGHVRFMAGHKQNSETYQQISSDLSLKMNEKKQ